MKIIVGNKRRNRTKKKRNKTKTKQKKPPKQQQKTTKQTFNAAKHAEIVFVVFPISPKNNSPVYTLDVIMNKTTI